MNWFKIGSWLAPYVATLILSVGICILGFRRYILPELKTSLEEAQKTITNLAKLGGVKSQEFKDVKALEKVVAKDVVSQALPELEALRMILSPSTWERIEEAMEENPEAILQLYQRYGHLLGIGEQGQKEQYMF